MIRSTDHSLHPFQRRRIKQPWLKHVTEPTYCHCTTVATSESTINNSYLKIVPFVQPVHSIHSLFGDRHVFMHFSTIVLVKRLLHDCSMATTFSLLCYLFRFRIQLHFSLVAMLTFCMIIRKLDHQKFLNFLPAVIISKN